MTRGLAKTHPRRVRAEERRRTALSLRRGGATLAQVAHELGVSRQAAHKLVTQALGRLARSNAVDAAAYRALELERLDVLSLKANGVLNAPDVSPTVALQAITALTKISAVRSRLLGLEEVRPPAEPDPKLRAAAEFKPILRAARTEELYKLREVIGAIKTRQQAQPAVATAVARPGLVPE